MPTNKIPDAASLDRIVAEARRNAERREKDYRAQALKLFPWVCGRCARTFTRENLQQLTVHHRNHNHDDSPPDGSNWELLCVYCHENEHSRVLESTAVTRQAEVPATHQPFADLRSLMKK